MDSIKERLEDIFRDMEQYKDEYEGQCVDIDTAVLCFDRTCCKSFLTKYDTQEHKRAMQTLSSTFGVCDSFFAEGGHKNKVVYMLLLFLRLIVIDNFDPRDIKEHLSKCKELKFFLEYI